MKRAMFGGTFDPIHRAHIVVAREAADAFGLDQVLMIPAGQPPHKGTGTPYEHRFRMVEIACKCDRRLVPSRIEEGQQRSYSIHTIEKLRADGGDLSFIIGSDAFAEIRTWYRASDVIQAVDFIVVSRPGHRYETPPGARVRRLETVAMPVSSSDIRSELARGRRPGDIDPAVADYILANGLYR